MLTKADMADIIAKRLGLEPGAVRPLSKASLPLPKRVFLSDWELKRLSKPGSKKIEVPANAIISPLSLDWLDYDGVEITRK